MSKNLTKASEWAQREINLLDLERENLAANRILITKRIEEIDARTTMLYEIKKQLSNGESLEEEKPTV